MGLDTTKEPDIVPGTITAGDGTTTVVTFDPVNGDFKRWFAEQPPRSKMFSSNEVIPYIRGKNLFKDVVSAIRTATSSEHFIYIAGWNLSQSKSVPGGDGEDLQLIPGDASSSIKALLTAADGKGVTIRALILKQDSLFGSRDSSDTVNFINTLANGAAIHDDHVVDGLAHVKSLVGGLMAFALNSHYVGAHHQKLIAIQGTEDLVVFQGGYDLDKDRLTGFGPGGTEGLHDVHTRIRGFGAWQVWSAFVERWNDHPQLASLPAPKNKPLPSLLAHGSQPDNVLVQLAHTFPNVGKHKLFDGGDNTFVPPPPSPGEATLKKMILNAISQAKKFIYIEDQYLVDMSISNALKAALPNINNLIILIVQTDSVEGELFQAWRRRKEFIDNLATIDRSSGTLKYTGKVVVCQLKSGYVHSKTWIFDDLFAIIGSANVNRRGMTHDSEQAAGIYDSNARRRWFFAHELRMNLWAKHLGKTPIDFVTPSAANWFTPIGDVALYDPDAKKDDPLATQLATKGFPGTLPPSITDDIFWDEVIDPDGT